MKRHAIKKGPIKRNFYSDPLEIKKEYPKTATVYETFLYESLTTGSFPKYKIKCLYKNELLDTVKKLVEKYGYKSINQVQAFKIPLEDAYLYEKIQILDTETGEIIDE